MSEHADATIAESGLPAAATAGTEWSVGERVLDQYDITAVHRGGMGVVYRARHLGWGTDVAVKCPRPELFRTDVHRERFVREARTWVDLGLHPHVCNCHYVRTIDGVPGVVAEYVAGGSLDDWIRDRRLYRGSRREVLARILDIAVQTAWGLEHAHALGVLHRDMKPANILVDHDQAVKVTDFGLAGAYTLPGATAGAYRGTRHYASPEQAAGDGLGPGSDVWSLAVSVLEMVTGEVTWMAGPAAGASLAHVRAAAPLGAVPGALGDLLARCLEWDPANRPSDMAEIVSALIDLYAAEIGEFYPRQRPSSARLRADELNNRALSLLDLGHDVEAGRVLEEALAADPRHPEASFNHGVLRWRAAEITDDAVLDNLEAARTNHAEPDRAQRLIDLVHLERGASAPEFTIAVQPGRKAATACVTPDGEHVLIGDDAGTIRVVELSTGRCLRTLTGHPEAVDSIRVDSDGRHALTASKDWTVRLWDLPTGRCLRTRRGRARAAAHHICLAADGNFAMINGLIRNADRARAWWLSGRGRGATLRAHDQVTSMCATPDGRRALVGDSSGAVGVWDLTTGRRLFSLHGHTGSIRAMAVDSGGRHAITTAEGFEELAARVWDLHTGRCVHVLDGHLGPLTSACVTPDGWMALTGSGDRTVRVWDVSTGRCLLVLTGHAHVVTSVFLPCDNLRIAATTDLAGVARIWELSTGRCLRTIADGVSHADAILLTPDERFVLHCGRSAVRVWALTPPVPSPLQICRSRTAVELSTLSSHVDGLLAQAAQAADQGNPSRALDLVRAARAQPGHERSSETMDAWRRLAPSSGPVGFRTAWLSKVLDGGATELTDVCMTPDGRHILSSGHADDAVWMWELSSGRRVARFLGHASTVWSVCVDPTGRFAVTGGKDGTARLWDLPSGDRARTLTGHSGSVRSVCTTPDGRLAITGAEDATARVWDLPSGDLRFILEGHTSSVISARTTPDGRFALTAGQDDGSVRQWDLTTGRCVRIPETFASGRLGSICVIPQGRL